MSKLRVSDREMLEGITVEWIDSEMIDLLPATGFREPDWTRHRKAAPFNRLLRHTLDWAETLPSKVKPDALMERYPRIANVLAANWQDPLAAGNCLRDLVIDTRGGRQGFPPEVLEDLVILRRYFTFGPDINARRRHR
ncbi:MAG: hypothetical protein ABJC33_07180 [Betaproteobacteria bacterium]